jgi:subtilisin family serine protease
MLDRVSIGPAVVCALALAVVPACAVAGARPGGPAVPVQPPVERVIVRWGAGTTAAVRSRARDRADVTRAARLGVRGMELVDPGRATTVSEAIADLQRAPGVLYAEPDVPRVSAAIPDDPFFGSQWGLQSTGQTVAGHTGIPGADIAAPSAWDVTTGSAAVTVAVVDTGIDLTHPDLRANLWANAGESGDGRESNGIDDDGDGLIDDVRGWDYVDRDAQPLDGNGHGTHVAGTIGASGNDGQGVAGVSWRVGLMALRVLDDSGAGYVSNLIRAYGYAADHGARVVNLSLGGGRYSRAENDAIAAAPGVLFVVAAGNDAMDNDATGAYPCDYGLDNVICVAASDRDDTLAWFSNYGATTVDLAAPGVDIASTWPSARWRYLDGTSMATPHVSGVAALLLARDGALRVADLRGALLSGVDLVPALAGRVATGGRLDAAGALGGPAATGLQSPPAASPPPAQSTPQTAPVEPSVPAAAPDRLAPGVSVRIERRRLGSVLRRGLRVTLRCSEACRATAAARVDARTARRLGLGRRAATIARAESRLTRAGRRALSIPLSARARRALRGASRVRVTVTAVAVDPSGNRRAASSAATLRA